jgi:hypothetical protein
MPHDIVGLINISNLIKKMEIEKVGAPYHKEQSSDQIL